MTTTPKSKPARRGFLLSAGTIAATPFVGGISDAFAQAIVPIRPAAAGAIERRRLGSLEVSAVGLGVQT